MALLEKVARFYNMQIDLEMVEVYERLLQCVFYNRNDSKRFSSYIPGSLWWRKLV